MIICERIKQVRHALGLSQREFSKALFMSSGYIGGIEVNYREPPTRVLKLIVSQFGVNEQWLVSGEGDMFGESDTKKAQILNLYNNLPADYKELALRLVKAVAEHTGEDFAHLTIS